MSIFCVAGERCRQGEYHYKNMQDHLKRNLLVKTQFAHRREREA